MSKEDRRIEAYNYKASPNKVDRGKIEKMYAEGLDASIISQRLRISQTSVERYAPAKARPTPRKLANE